MPLMHTVTRNAEIQSGANRFARALDALGVAPRASFTTLLPNVAEFLWTYRAAASLPPERRISVGGPIPGFRGYTELVERFGGEDLERPLAGDTMLYTSGTTGRPRRVVAPDRDVKAGTSRGAKSVLVRSPASDLTSRHLSLTRIVPIHL